MSLTGRHPVILFVTPLVCLILAAVAAYPFHNIVYVLALIIAAVTIPTVLYYMIVNIKYCVQLLIRRYYTRKNYLKCQRFALDTVKKMFLKRCLGQPLYTNLSFKDRCIEAVQLIQDLVAPPFEVDPDQGGRKYELTTPSSMR
jgi:hypothetical protein